MLGFNVLLVVEQIADSALRYDIGRKAALYASLAIRELWVIDAVRLATRVFQKPAAGGYRSASDLDPADRITPLIAPQAFAHRPDELERA
jgi:Uma2 family endonuclease